MSAKKDKAVPHVYLWVYKQLDDESKKFIDYFAQGYDRDALVIGSKNHAKLAAAAILSHVQEVSPQFALLVEMQIVRPMLVTYNVMSEETQSYDAFEY